MAALAGFAVTRCWPPRRPHAVQIYAAGTPNGRKVPVACEEMGLAYDAHRLDLGAGEQHLPAFRAISPNGKIPAIIDPAPPEGAVAVADSGAILIHLAERTGRLLPAAGAARAETLSWLMFQIGHVGPMFGQLGWFRGPKGREIDDPRPRRRYADEVRRLLGVMETALDGREWIAGGYSIADIAICPWLRGLRDFQKAGEEVGWADFCRVDGWLERFLARPAVARGIVEPR